MEKVPEIYCRTNEVLGRGAFKTVYRAFDRTQGIEVAWNHVDLQQLDECDIRQLKSEVRLLRELNHKNIIRCYEAWIDERHNTLNLRHNTLNFITELCTSGTLREYRERHGHVEPKVIKSWATQILKGLVYFHGLQPPIAHRDLKCDNIFINGNTGEVKIGDLRLACVMRAAKPKRAVLGTPEYMAPEILDRNYSELVDVYSFGMCVLEMVTVEYPYEECCGNVSETFVAINGGKKPEALKKVKDPVVRDLIEKCLEPLGRRPPASALLSHPFFQKSEPIYKRAMEKVPEIYCRTNEVLGRGSSKTVYRAFDRTKGIEVAWNHVDLLQLGECDIRQPKSEVCLLRELNHKNIIRYYEAWIDERHNTFNFITELCTSGTLREYRERYGHVDPKVIKSWATQILKGLVYLHGLQPPIAHRDLKCDNIFINGNTGEVKIGDLGLACVMRAAKPKRAVLGTPEYMAPEILKRNYSELVDVYSFGMCVLEMVTVKYPYEECCGNVPETFDAITGGIKPQALEKVKDPVVRDLIEKCLEPLGRRPPASALLSHPFFQKSECPDVLTDQSAVKSPIDGTQSGAPVKVHKSPPEPRRPPVGFMRDEASYPAGYPGSPLRADKFEIPGHARHPEGFHWKVIETKIEPTGRLTRERRVTMYPI